MDETNNAMICFTWNKSGDIVYVTGAFNSYNLLKLESDNMTNEKRATIWVKPGKVFYRYVVDGRELCDLDKPSEIVNGKHSLIKGYRCTVQCNRRYVSP